MISEKKQLNKFGENRFGIVNGSGQVVSEDYLRRYIHCWCRVSNGFVTNRKSNLDYFMSDEFLKQHVGKTASQIGKIASKSPRWNRIVEPMSVEEEIEDASIPM